MFEDLYEQLKEKAINEYNGYDEYMRYFQEEKIMNKSQLYGICLIIYMSIQKMMRQCK